MINNKFDLEARLHEIYTAYPEGESRPVIGITANYAQGDATLRDRYYRQIEAAGGIPVIIPPIADRNVIVGTLDRIDALLLTGGGDYNPLWTAEEPVPQLGNVNAERDLPELLITRLAYNRQIPMLGICRGMQTLAIALGGTVAQHATMQIKHSQDADRTEPTHTVTITPDTILSSIYPTDRMYVNSFHHQAVTSGGAHLTITATAPDGVAEALESSEQKSILGVQWHPEWLGIDGLPLFRWLTDRARLFAKAKSIHRDTLSVDSHCDTPMFFPQGVDFCTRDPRILVDLHKMTDGHLDATTMVAYLPQPKPGQTFKEIAPLPANTPHEYADMIFDRIEQTISAHPTAIRQARTPIELLQNKAQGLKSIMLGIENGLAIEDNIEYLRYFARRGIVYVTLCHNGDNAICDSARGSATHGGVSPWGEQVIQQMNRLGLMVDLSHAAESSFYNALEISATPIVCSHSNCKSLCDVPRNLTDDQLRAIAAKGGVVQITLYHGFLKKNAEATITDAISHLEHAISVMGIDHVGLGTDFDGDGGVKGLADASELIQFTQQLLMRRYSRQDIAAIWGGNWLRVMTQVQQQRQL